MLPSGVLVRADFGDLVSALPGRLLARGPSGLEVDALEPGRMEEEGPALRISRWSDEWCLVEVLGPEELGVLLMESLVVHEPMGEVLSCHYRPDLREYGYDLFRSGRSLETFRSAGPSMENVNFRSELRRVPLQSLLRASQFMLQSMDELGVPESGDPAVEEGSALLSVTFPARRTLWQRFLGAFSRR